MMFFGLAFYTNKLPNDTALTALAIIWVVVALLCSAIAVVIEFCRWFTSSDLVSRIVKLAKSRSSINSSSIGSSSGADSNGGTINSSIGSASGELEVDDGGGGGGAGDERGVRRVMLSIAKYTRVSQD